jgi:PAPA-1-like protein
MRRQEMARRRRNLSDKRNEEVKVCGCPAFRTKRYHT